MKNLLFSLLGILLINFTSAQIIDSSYTLTTEAGPVVGTLTLTEEKPENLVIIVPGSGPTDRNGNNPMGLNTNTYQMISDSMAAKDISSLRYDKRGIGKSVKVDENKLTFNTYVEDLIKWIVKVKKELTPATVVLLGHSEGSLIAMLAAEQEKVDGLISVAGPALPADTLLLQQLSKQPGLYSMAKPVIDSLSMGYQVQKVPPMLVSVFRPSVQPYLISWFRYDPATVIHSLSIPVLIINGTNDIQVPEANGRQLKAAAGQNASLQLIENMNHVLKSVSGDDVAANMATYSQPELPLHQQFVKSVTDFIKGL